MSRLALLLLFPAALLGCQPSAATRSGETLTPVSAAPPLPPLAVFYTHDGAEALYHAGRYADSEAMCLEAIATIEKGRGKDSPELAPPLIDLATVYMRLAQFNKAHAVIDRAESVLNPDIPAQALLLGRLGINKGWRLYSLGETEAARTVFENSLTLIEKNQKGDSKDSAELLNNIALMDEEIASDNDDAALLQQSRRTLLRAWEIRRRLTGDNSPESGESLNNLGMDLLLNPQKSSDLDSALNVLKKSLEVSIIAYGEQNPETAVSRTNLALAYLLHDNLEDAEKQLNIAMPITLRFLGDKAPDRAYELTALGRIYQEQMHYAEAEKAFLEAVSINEAVYGKSHPNVASTLEYLSHLYEAEGDDAKQAAIQRRIEKIGGKGI